MKPIPRLIVALVILGLILFHAFSAPFRERSSRNNEKATTSRPSTEIGHKKSPGEKGIRPVLPSGLFQISQRLHLNSGNSPVDITYGNLPRKGNHAGDVLAANGWKVVSAETPERPIQAAFMKNGKETYIAFLEKHGGSYLLLRRVEE